MHSKLISVLIAVLHVCYQWSQHKRTFPLFSLIPSVLCAPSGLGTSINMKVKPGDEATWISGHYSVDCIVQCVNRLGTMMGIWKI